MIFKPGAGYTSLPEIANRPGIDRQRRCRGMTLTLFCPDPDPDGWLAELIVALTGKMFAPLIA